MNKKNMKKVLVFGIMLLFFAASIIPSVTSSSRVNVTTAATAGVIIVDDEGDGDYDNIADALANASEGDTIEVYSGTYVGRNLIVGMQVYLKGIEEEYESGDDEGKPVVDGEEYSNVFKVEANEVEISGFHIINSGTNNNGGIAFFGNYDNAYIHHNNISHNFMGVLFFQGASDTIVTLNEFYGNSYQLNLHSTSSGITVYYNDFMNEHNTQHDNSGDSTWDFNYWQDYDGVDEDGDGIGDTPYEVDDGVYDVRPRMWSGEEIDPPFVEIVRPAEKEIYFGDKYVMDRIFFTRPLIIGAITVSVNASDNRSGMQKVEFYFDGELMATVPRNLTGTTYNWTCMKMAFGRKVIKVIAYDNVNHSAEAEIEVFKIF